MTPHHSTAIDASSQFKVLSYNIRYDTPADRTYAWRYRREYVASNIRFHDPAVVGLQEALHDQLDDLRDRLPDFEWLPSGRAESTNPGEHAAIGYDPDRFRLESDDTFWLSESPDEVGSIGWDAALPRVVRYAEFTDRRGEDTFYLFNVHFDHVGAAARRESAHLLSERITETVRDVPVIVTGDLNCRETDEPYKYLTDPEADDRRPLQDTRYKSRHPHHGPETSVTDYRNVVIDRKIDYVFVTHEFTVNIHGVCSDIFADGQFPSDHLPVLAQVRL